MEGEERGSTEGSERSVRGVMIEKRKRQNRAAEKEQEDTESGNEVAKGNTKDYDEKYSAVIGEEAVTGENEGNN